MNALRILLTTLVVALLLALVLAGLAFVPSVQTWAAQQALNRRPGLRGSIGSLSADLGSIEVSDLHLKPDGADLQIPSLTADLPVIPAVWRRRAAVRRLVAKGWTLDLRTTPEAETAGDAAESAPVQAAAVFHGILDRLVLPCDLALDGVELEGEVFLPGAKPKSSIRVHVVLRGGGLAAGKEGGFDFEASSSTLDAERQLVELAGRGRLALAMATPRTFGRVGLSSVLSAQGGPFPAGIRLKADASAARNAEGETYTLALDRGVRRVAEFAAALTGGGSRLAGTWKLDGSDSDIAPFLPDRPLPAFQAAGAGRFDCDAGFGRVHAQGDFTATLSRLEVLTPALEGAGTVRLAADFDATHDGHSLQVDRLDATATGPGPTATVRALHPFAIDERTGDLQDRPSEAADWLNVSLRSFPLALITGLPGGLTIAGGAAAGDFTIRRESGGFVLRSRSPFSAAGVSLRRAGRLIARRLDLSASLVAQRKSDGWEIQASPLRLVSAGRPLGELTFRLSRPDGADQPFALTGTWKADLAAIAAQAVFPDLGWLAGRSAAGEFSTAGGASPTWDGKLTATGEDPRNSIAATFHTELGQQGTLSFTIPLKITQASGASEFSLEGMWSEDESGHRLSLQLNGQDVREEDVQALALPLIGSEMTAGPASGGAPDRAPFWGGWVGSLRIAFDKLSAGGKSYADVGASFEIGADSIRLQGGHVELDHPRGARAEGELTFSPSRPHPYQVRAKVAIDPFKAGPYFPPADADSYASIEGKVAIDAFLAGQGDNLPDLVRHTAETFQLTSTDSIVRFLKTDVHEAIPHDESSRFSEGLSTVGSTVGSFFGGHRDGSTAARNPVSPTAEAMIDFTQEAAEIGFDRAAVTAVREADGSFRLTAIDLAGEREHIVGTGVIAAAAGIPLLDRPLSLDLVFWAHGRAARLLAKANLLSAEKDSHGFFRLNQVIHLGGTLGQVDATAWHRLLVRAAAQNPAGAKKKSD